MTNNKKEPGIIDGNTVDDKAFPLAKGKVVLEIVGSCPKCGAPIYGSRMIFEGNSKVEYSCSCRMEGKDIHAVTRHT